MATCPKCKTKVISPSKTWSILDDPDDKGSMTERKVGFYECTYCTSRFPHIFGRQRLKIVKSEQWQKLKLSITEEKDKNSTLQQKIDSLEDEQERLRSGIALLEDKITLAVLEGEEETLQREVELLTNAKKELEGQVANYCITPHASDF